MVEEIKQMLEPKEEMSEEKEEKEELSAVEKVTHNPETETKPNLNLFAQNRTLSTADKVLQRISQIKK